MDGNTTKLWRYSTTLGEWVLERVIMTSAAALYLETSRRDDPQTQWCVANNKPRRVAGNP